MANDVFGRPMNEKITSFPTNVNIAPNPLDAGPQDEPFSGIRGPGDLGTSRASTSEFMGAQYAITAPRPGIPEEDHSSDWSPNSPGGHTMPAATPRNPM